MTCLPIQQKQAGPPSLQMNDKNKRYDGSHMTNIIILPHAPNDSKG